MKYICCCLFVLILILIMASPLQAREKVVCSLIYGPGLIRELPKGLKDKTQHCTISCQLAHYCPALDVLAAGALKEFWDGLGFGTPDWDDLRANKEGVIYSRSYEKDECLAVCANHYE